MTDVTPKLRSRARTLKTWSAFGNLGRRPTEYEIVTHNLNHTTGAVPLEMGPDVHGNVWLREHRDSMRLKVDDWDAFRDPDSVTYGSYVAGQDDQETYVEGLLEQFDKDGYDESLTPEAIALLFRVLTPSRYLAHGQQMLSAYLQQLAVSSYVSNCAAFQTADQLRRVQLTAYRTTQLRLALAEDSSDPEAPWKWELGERRHWEGNPDWQPLREAVELALVEFDWDRAFVITNLVLKPLADLITLDQLSEQAAALGAALDSLVLENLYRDSLRSQRWTTALVTFLNEADPANRGVLQEYLTEFAPLAEKIISGGAALLGTPGGRAVDEIESAVRAGWAGLLEPLGLRTSGS